MKARQHYKHLSANNDRVKETIKKIRSKKNSCFTARDVKRYGVA